MKFALGRCRAAHTHESRSQMGWSAMPVLVVRVTFLFVPTVRGDPNGGSAADLKQSTTAPKGFSAPQTGGASSAARSPSDRQVCF